MESVEFYNEEERKMFTKCANDSGVTLIGGSATERKNELVRLFEEESAVINCEEISSKDEFVREVIRNNMDMCVDDMSGFGIPEVKDALEHGRKNLVLANFDSMDVNIQEVVADILKAVLKRSDWSGSLGFTCEESSSVVDANQYFSAGIRVWNLSE